MENAYGYSSVTTPAGHIQFKLDPRALAEVDWQFIYGTLVAITDCTIQRHVYKGVRFRVIVPGAARVLSGELGTAASGGYKFS